MSAGLHKQGLRTGIGVVLKHAVARPQTNRHLSRGVNRGAGVGRKAGIARQGDATSSSGDDLGATDRIREPEFTGRRLQRHRTIDGKCPRGEGACGLGDTEIGERPWNDGAAGAAERIADL